MVALIGVLVGAGVAVGLIMMVYGLLRHPPAPVKARRPVGERWAAATRRPSGRAGRRRDIKLAVVAVVSLAVFAFTHWFAAIIVIPVAVLAVPWLLANQNKAGITQTAALEVWVRSLRSLLQSGSDNTLEAALRGSLANADPLIRDDLARLVSRMNARVSTDIALADWARDVADPIAEEIAIHLILASGQSGIGLSEVLAALSEAVSDEVRARRRIEAERGTARVAARYMTFLLAGTGVLFSVFNPAFLAPYATGLGQGLLVAILAAFVGVLAVLRRITKAPQKPRLYPVATNRGRQYVR